MQTRSRSIPVANSRLTIDSTNPLLTGNGNGSNGSRLAMRRDWTSRIDFPQNAPRLSNKVLQVLSPETWARIEPQGRRVLLHQNETLHERGAVAEYVYFVEHGMVSLLADAHNGMRVEACIVGHEGMVGTASLLEKQPALHHAIVQVRGKAFRLPARVFQDEWQRDAVLREWSLRYAHLMLSHTSQGVLCNRLHGIEERLCRWLLTVRDRIESDELELTHEFIAHMLGTRRSGVTMALGMLQRRKLIECSRGHILILDDTQLKTCACECYAHIAQSYDVYEDFLNRFHSFH